MTCGSDDAAVLHDKSPLISRNVLVVGEKVFCVLLAERWAEFSKLVWVSDHVQVIPVVVESCLGFLAALHSSSSLW